MINISENFMKNSWHVAEKMSYQQRVKFATTLFIKLHNTKAYNT